MITLENSYLLLIPTGLLFALCIALFIWAYLPNVKRILGMDNIGSIPDVKTGNISIIEQQEPTSGHFDLSLISRFIIFPMIIAFTIWQVYLWITGKTTPQFGISTIWIPIGLWGLLLVVLVDTMFFSHSYYGMSFVVSDDIHYIFHICLYALKAMNATKIKMKEPRLLSGHINNSKITITIRHRITPKIKAYIQSDIVWVDVRLYDAFDSQIRDTFMDLFHRYAPKRIK